MFCRWLAEKNGILVLLLGAFFVLQASHLPSRLNIGTDEGGHTEEGRQMLAGVQPYVDFPMHHMPLVPLISGLGYEVFGGLTIPRFLFLGMNFLGAWLLYLAMIALVQNRLAGLVALVFYLSFHEMVITDFRFIAIRQTANFLLILSLYLLVRDLNRQTSSKNGALAQLMIWLAMGLSYLPGGVSLALVALGVSCQQSGWREKWKQVRPFFGIGMVALGSILAFFYLVPQSYQYAVQDLVDLPAFRKGDRLLWIKGWEVDGFFMALGHFGLFASAVLIPRLRFVALAMLGVVYFNIIPPQMFRANYISILGPSMAFGVFGLVVVFSEWALQLKNRVARVVMMLLVIGVVGYQLSLSMPLLWRAWTAERDPKMTRLVEVLKKQASPLIAFETMYALEAGLELQPRFNEFYLRSVARRRPLTQKSVEQAFQESCSLVVDQYARAALSAEVLDEWQSRASLVASSAGVSVYSIPGNHCQTSR